jgi:LCP family protein required for cell wall assembly
LKRALFIKLTIYCLLSVFVIVILTGSYIWYSMQKTMGAMYEPLPSTQWVQPVFEKEDQLVHAASRGKSTSPDPITTSSAVEWAEQLHYPHLDHNDPFCILLLGVDEREGDRGRSDTMILLALQPAKESAIAISIPRDTRVLMPNSGLYDKINHAYAFGGTPQSVAAVENLFGVPIAYYMKTNMEGLVDIVDTVGGIDVDNQIKFESVGFSFPLGEQHLNGEEALAYIRMRKQDPQGDFGRTQRQRQVLSSAVDHVVSFRFLGKLPHLLTQLSKDVRTNLTSQDMLSLAMEYRPAIQSVETLYVQGVGKMINGIYYYMVEPETRQKIQEQLFNHLIAT